MNFMRTGGDKVSANGDGVGMGLKLMGWVGRGKFCGDGVGMGLMSTTVSLFNTDAPKMLDRRLVFPNTGFLL